MTHTKLTRFAAVAAPVAIIVGWAIQHSMGTEGREPGWTLAHLAWLAAYPLLIPVSAALYRVARPPAAAGRVAARVYFGLSVFGAASLAAQMLIDLVSGWATASNDAMHAFTEKLTSAPGVELVVYILGPAVLFIALAAQAIDAAARRRVPALAPICVSAAVLVMLADRLVDTPVRLTMPVAAVLLLIGLLRATTGDIRASRAAATSGV
ncbi:MAG TPA: hypothetical protein VE172_12195 [Stackebrandtia sp.]|jgi:hypothetical protein|uniref:hypothetical protein n=1 Tax=Stackebrandtia sp. TaxID=2023065 RepID=UPI002D3E9BBB|nr:hypothetical protein [Stackebrandtia sp.]HZE39561.1 hypothetical protein [Stackebrandtia sp.]